MSVHKFNNTIAQILNEGPLNHSVKGPVKLQHASPERRALIDKKISHEISANDHKQLVKKHQQLADDNDSINMAVSDHHRAIADMHSNLHDSHSALAKHYEDELKGMNN